MPAGSISRPSTSAGAAPGARGAAWAPAAAAAVVAAGLLAVYRGTGRVPLLFDDLSSIATNPTLRHLDLGALLPPATAGVGGRPLLNLSFALNYAAGGTAVAGYHAVNVVIHLFAAWTLLALVRRTLLRCAPNDALRGRATAVALFATLLWAWHPVQTEAVTYLSQRAESLMGLFYLLTLYAFTRYAHGAPGEGGAAGSDAGSASRTGGLGWAAVAVGACLAGALTKEVIVTAPFLVLLFDRTFIAGSFGAAWRRHWPVLVALAAAAWIPVALLMTGLAHRGVGFGSAVGPWAYALIEAKALVHYLRLAVWPDPLVFDYGPATLTTFAAAWPYVIAVLAMLAATVFALRRWPVAGFFPAAFFLILAPTSSFVPVVWEPVAESRLYLPLAAVATGAVLAAFAFWRRWAVPVCVVAALAVGGAAARRNETYASALSLWRDTVAQRPDNPRARNFYGDALAKSPGRLPDAVAQYEAALRLQPDLAEAHNNLGTALEKMPGRLTDAVAEFETAIRQRPDFAAAHYNLAATLARIPGGLPDAIAEYRAALRLDPGFAAAHYNLGTALEQLPGGAAAAIPEYEAALRLDPANADAHASLASVLASVGRRDAATSEYREALHLSGGDAAVHYNFANLLRDMPGGLEQAIVEYEAALRIRPDYVDARNNLGTALTAAGRAAEAKAQFQAALKLDPTYIPARLNYAVALIQAGDRAGAATELRAVLRIAPENVPARQLLVQLGVSP